jgi:hypothetical protein
MSLQGSMTTLLFVSCCLAASAERITAEDVEVVRGTSTASSAINRTLMEVLGDFGVSVKDFGASGRCFAHASGGSECPDDSVAFRDAITSGWDGRISIRVPFGMYRVDSAIELGTDTHIHFDAGATLVRTNASASDGPLLRLASVRSRVTGQGILLTMNPSPHGVVHIGPSNASKYSLVEFGLLSDVTLQGAGISSHGSGAAGGRGAAGGAMPTNVGLFMDSSEPQVGGCNYQNTVRDVKVANVDVGVLVGEQVNGNTLINVQLNSIGDTGYHLQGPNSENTVLGGFISGSQKLHQVILGEASAYNYFIGVQGEPGGGRLFDFDAKSQLNTVIGHDNCPDASRTRDAKFLYIDAGKVHAGDFSARGEVDYTATLEARGDAVIDHLRPPVSGTTPASPVPPEPLATVAIHDDEPVVLSARCSQHEQQRQHRNSANGAEVPMSGMSPVFFRASLSHLRQAGPLATSATSAAAGYYELTVSGGARRLGGEAGAGAEVAVFQGRWLLTPYSKPCGAGTDSQRRPHAPCEHVCGVQVLRLGASEGVSILPVKAAGNSTNGASAWLQLQLSQLTQGTGDREGGNSRNGNTGDGWLVEALVRVQRVGTQLEQPRAQVLLEGGSCIAQ